MPDRLIDGASRLLRDAMTKFKGLTTTGKAIVLALPIVAFAALEVGGPADGNMDRASASMPWGDQAAVSASTDSFFRTPNGIISEDLERELDAIARNSVYLEEQTGQLDYEESIELLEQKVATAAAGRDLIEEVRDSEIGSVSTALIADAMALLAAGDVWGAVANLLVAHEAEADSATPLLSLAGLANSQGLPEVALALLEATRQGHAEDWGAPAGISKQAAWLNNRGHALLLLGHNEEAEPLLRQAVMLNPELSEAARNLVYVLLKQNKRDEARTFMPRVLFRVPGSAAEPVSVKQESTEQPDEDQIPADQTSPEVWVKNPYLLADESGNVRLPVSIALDMSRKGQIAWPEIVIPEAGDAYPQTLALANQRYLQAETARRALEQQKDGLIQTAMGKRLTWSDRVQQAIEVRAGGIWLFHEMDTEMQVLEASYERQIVSGDNPSRFDALNVARADYQMAVAADRLYERYGRESQCEAGASLAACCAIQRAANDKNIREFTPIAQDFVDRSRVLFSNAYGWASAYTSNLPQGAWYSMARLDTEQGVLNTQRFTQMNVYMDFVHAAPLTAGRCYQPVEPVASVLLEIDIDAPACEALFGKASAKFTMGKYYSISVGCSKVKISVKAAVGVKKLAAGPVDVGAEIGLQGEIEISMKGTVTIFAGPYASLSAKADGRGIGADVKDGVYMVVGREGIQDAGFRVSVGGSASASSSVGGSEPIMETMDFSVVSAI